MFSQGYETLKHIVAFEAYTNTAKKSANKTVPYDRLTES